MLLLVVMMPVVEMVRVVWVMRVRVAVGVMTMCRARKGMMIVCRATMGVTIVCRARVRVPGGVGTVSVDEDPGRRRDENRCYQENPSALNAWLHLPTHMGSVAKTISDAR